MSTTDIQKVKEELVVFLRNSDIFTTTVRGVTTASQTASGTGASQVITLANNIVRNIRSVNDGSAKRAYFDYTPSYGASSTTITGTFAAGTSNITISYDYSTAMTEKIWPDYPELGNPELTIDSFPRLGFEIIADRTEPIGIGTTNWLSDMLASIRIYSKSPKDIDGYITTLRSKIKASQSSLYYSKLMYITNTGPLITHDELAGKIKERGLDVITKFRFES